MREFVAKQNQNQRANSIDLARHWQVTPTQKQDPVHDLLPLAAPVFGHDFSRIPAQGNASVIIQPKLSVSTPGDMYEQEADRIANQVMRAHEPQLQRTCACGGGCSSCQNEQVVHEHLQTKSAQTNNSMETAVPPIVHEVLRSPGHPLDESSREFMESRLGHDFSRVRVHTDTRAAHSARTVNAIAYTVGRNVVFGPGRYEPASTQGRRLLAHELTHVVQQGEGKIPSRLVVGYSKDRLEQEAEMMARGSLGISSAQHDASAANLQRAPTEEDLMDSGADLESAEFVIKKVDSCTDPQVKCSVCKVSEGETAPSWSSDCAQKKPYYIYSYGNIEKGRYHYECSQKYDPKTAKAIPKTDHCRSIPVGKRKRRH